MGFTVYRVNNVGLQYNKDCILYKKSVSHNCFCPFQINDLPKPSYMNKTLSELKIGTYDNIETAIEDTSIILALKKFVERRVSALPIIDPEGRLVDIYAKFDVIVSIYHAC